MSNDYDEGYRAGLQKARDVARPHIESMEARIKELEANLKWVLKQCDATSELMLKRAETAEASLEKVKDLVERAFVEGCHEGMNEFATSRGGKTWEESRTIKMLSTVKGQDDD